MWPSINAWDNSIIQARTSSLRDNNHSRYLLVFFKNVLVFISFVRRHFYFYIIFVLKINIVFVSINDGQNICVSVIVTVTEISLIQVERSAIASSSWRWSSIRRRRRRRGPVVQKTAASWCCGPVDRPRTVPPGGTRPARWGDVDLGRRRHRRRRPSSCSTSQTTWSSRRRPSPDRSLTARPRGCRATTTTPPPGPTARSH